MSKYIFNITIEGIGVDPEAAWANARDIFTDKDYMPEPDEIELSGEELDDEEDCE